MAKQPRTTPLSVKKPVLDVNKTPAAEAETRTPLLGTVILATNAQIHGRNTITLTQGDFSLKVFQDNTMNTFVTSHKDTVLSVLRGHRRTAISTFGLHIATIARLAVNLSEEAASAYLQASEFFDNNLRAFAVKSQHVVDLQYTHTGEEGVHTGYVFIAGKNFMHDDHIPAAAEEDLLRALPYIKNFCDRYLLVEKDTDMTLLVDGQQLNSNPLKW